MKAIITVLGPDKVGIIAAVCVYLSNNGINILDLSQTIVGGFFNMLMIADFTHSPLGFDEAAAGLARLGREIGLEIKLQREDIFNSMHRI
jgi:ACT domain-containing protein